MPSVLSQQLAKLIATFFYVGFSPVAPGTLASFLSLVLLLVIPGSPLEAVVGLGLLLPLGLWATATYSQENPEEDPRENVIDEVIGICVAFLFVERAFWTYFIGFLLFRICDILKPFPIKAIERLRNPWGIVMDDVLAGAYANLGLRLVGVLLG